MTRTPQEVMAHHSQALGAADLNEIVADFAALRLGRRLRLFPPRLRCFDAKRADHLRLSLVVDLEILALQILDRLAVLIAHHYADLHKVYTQLECGIGVPRRDFRFCIRVCFCRLLRRACLVGFLVGLSCRLLPARTRDPNEQGHNQAEPTAVAALRFSVNLTPPHPFPCPRFLDLLP